MRIPLSKQEPLTSIHVCSHTGPSSFYSSLAAVLGIGERVGITPLGGLVACLYAANPEYVKSKYNLPMLREIENLVAEAVGVNVPFMNPVTCVCLFRATSVIATHTSQRLLCLYTQGWYPRQGNPQQPQHVRDPQARRFWLDSLCLHWVSNASATMQRCHLIIIVVTDSLAGTPSRAVLNSSVFNSLMKRCFNLLYRFTR